jgi:hypothetical protein
LSALASPEKTVEFHKTVMILLDYISIYDSSKTKKYGVSEDTVPSITINSDLMGSLVWPPQEDLFLKKILNYYNQSTINLNFHQSVACMMELRIGCGLRGVRPSQLLGPENFHKFVKESSLELPSEVSLTSDGDIIALRHEFLLQCFRRLGSNTEGNHKYNSVYKLVELWKLPADEVRLSHMMALMERLDSDDVVEQLMNKVEAHSCLCLHLI